jgi:hypothetical protein
MQHRERRKAVETVGDIGIRNGEKIKEMHVELVKESSEEVVGLLNA